MIPQRFAIPLLVAAALHAALFAVYPEGTSHPPLSPPTLVAKLVLPPLPPDFFEPPPEAEAKPANMSAGSPVPQIPEPLAPPAEAEFEMTASPVAPQMAPIEPGAIPVEGPGWGGGGDGVGLTGGVFTPDLLDREPHARVRVPPEYPYEAKRVGQEGEVEVAFVVGPDGLVRDAYVVRSSSREFEAAAVRAVLRWKFTPGQYRGRAVSSRMSVPIVFRLDDSR